MQGGTHIVKVIGFDHLGRDTVKNVVHKFIYRLESQLSERNVTINLTDAAQDWLAEHGYDKAMGARPLARLIADKIKKPLAEELLFGRLTKGGHILVKLAGDKLDFEFTAEKAKAEKPKGERDADGKVPEYAN